MEGRHLQSDSQSSSTPSLLTPCSSSDSSQRSGRSALLAGQDALRTIIHVPRPAESGLAITKIENILETLLDGTLKGASELSIPLKTRKRGRGVLDNSHRSRRICRVSYPGKNEVEARKFAATLQILKLSHEALLSGNVITKRGIYYRYPGLFQRQNVVNEIVDNLALTLNLGRDSFNIVADSRGLVSGHIQLVTRDGSVIFCSPVAEDGVSIPPLRRLSVIALSYPRWILVVEKEATFRTLTESRFSSTSSAGEGILMTGKGYPDLAIRQFLNLVSSACPSIPIYIVVDYDPDSIRILRTYKYGSQSLDHEANATIPEIRWLGIHSGDIVDLKQRSDDASQSSRNIAPVEASQLTSSQNSVSGAEAQKRHNRGHFHRIYDHAVALTPRDRRSAVGILEDICRAQRHDMDALKQAAELRVMLVLNLKAEIQFVDNYNGLVSWLDDQLVG